MSDPSERDTAEQLARLSRLMLNVANLLADATRLKKRLGASGALLEPCFSKIEAALSSIRLKDAAGAKQSVTEGRKMLKALRAKVPRRSKSLH